MTPADLKRIPFNEIAEAFRHSSHSRRMAGVMVALYPNANRFHVLARTCMSPEFVEAVGTTKNEAVVAELLRAEMLPLNRVCALAERAPIYRRITNKHDPGADLEDNTLMALGSPLIGRRATELLTQFPTSSLPHSVAVRNALIGNPLVHGLGDFPSPNRNVEWKVFLQNASLYGNLSNASVSFILTDVLEGSGDLLQNGDCAVVMSHLANRSDISDELAAAFHKSKMGSSSSKRELFKNPVHQKLVHEGKLDGILMLDGSEQYVVSPDVKAGAIQRVYDEETGSQSRRTSLLYAAQCPEAIYLKEKDCTDLLSDKDFLAYSPYAKRHLVEIPKAALWDTFRNGFLDTQLKYNDGLQSISLSSIPFNLITPNNLREVFAQRSRDAAFIVGTLRSRAFAEALGTMDGTSTDLARVLSPSTSGVQLEKFASLHPEMSALAACHPNGRDVTFRASDERQIEEVARIRGQVLLPGRMRVSSLQSRDNLVI